MILTHAKAYIDVIIKEMWSEKEHKINNDIEKYYLQGLNDREITKKINKKYNKKYSEAITHYRRITGLTAPY